MNSWDISKVNEDSLKISSYFPDEAAGGGEEFTYTISYDNNLGLVRDIVTDIQSD